MSCCISLLLLACSYTGSDNESAKTSGKLNVVLLLVDTLRADRLGLYGHDRNTDPQLTQLARDSILFEQARSQAGCTFPSVNSILTSRWPQPFVEGMGEFGVGIPDHVPTVAEIVRDAGYSTAAVSASTIVRVNPSKHNPDGGFGAGFETFVDTCLWKPAGCVNDKAKYLLERMDEPFFLYLHYLDPHMPFAPPKGYQRRFATETPRTPWIADGKFLPLNDMLYNDGPPVELNQDDLHFMRALYDDEVSYFDSTLPNLVNTLKTFGLWDRTLLIVASDHGEELMDHGHLFHCRDLIYETVIKTPLLMRIPGETHGSRSEALVQNLDIVPTVLDYLGLPQREGFAGTSLRPVISGKRSVNRFSFASQRYARSITSKQYKLTYDIKSGAVRLFDLRTDPAETKDVAPDHPEVAERLRTVLNRWMEAVEGHEGAHERARHADEVTERLRAVGYL